MGCTRQTKYHVAIQRFDAMRAKVMAEMCIIMLCQMELVVTTEMLYTHKYYGYSIHGMPISDHHLLVRGTRYTAIPVISVAGIPTVYLRQGPMDGDQFVVINSRHP